MGPAPDMRAMAEALDQMKAGMVAAYRDKSGRDDAEIDALLRDETWFSAHEAVALGLADRVEAPVKMAAPFDLSRFRNAPPQLAALAATSSPQVDDMPDFKKASPAQVRAGMNPQLRSSHHLRPLPMVRRRPSRPAGRRRGCGACSGIGNHAAACGRGGRSPCKVASAGERAGDRPRRGPC